MNKNYWQGKNIRLRALEEKDLEMFIAGRSSPDSVRQWYEDEISFPASEQEVRKSYEAALEEYTKEDKRIFVIETLDEKYIGEIWIWYTKKRAGLFRYGIFFIEEARGKGYGQEALRIVLDFYFNELNYQKAAPLVYGYNQGSQRFHEKLGFLLEGRARNELYTRGSYHDILFYGMLKDEFNRLYQHDFMR